MSTQGLKDEIAKKLYLIQEKERLENNLNTIAEPASLYNLSTDNKQKEIQESIELTEAQLQGLLAGLDDVLMGRVYTNEQVDAELDELFAKWENEKN